MDAESRLPQVSLTDLFNPFGPKKHPDEISRSLEERKRECHNPDFHHSAYTVAIPGFGPLQRLGLESEPPISPMLIIGVIQSEKCRVVKSIRDVRPVPAAEAPRAIKGCQQQLTTQTTSLKFAVFPTKQRCARCAFYPGYEGGRLRLGG